MQVTNTKNRDFENWPLNRGWPLNSGLLYTGLTVVYNGRELLFSSVFFPFQVARDGGALRG